MPYNKNTNYDNEVKYLNSLISGNNANQAKWAQQQMKQLNAWKGQQPKQSVMQSKPLAPVGTSAPKQQVQQLQPNQQQFQTPFQMPNFNDIYGGMLGNMQFDMKDYISGQQSAIQAQVDKYLNDQNLYYDNLGGKLTSQYEAQSKELNTNFEANQEDINKQTYEQLERSKSMGSMRGMTSSAQQVGMDNAVSRAGMSAHTANAENRQSSLEKLNNQLNQAREQLATGKQKAIDDSSAMYAQQMGQVQRDAMGYAQNAQQQAFQGALQMYSQQQGLYGDLYKQYVSNQQQEKMWDKDAGLQLSRDEAGRTHDKNMTNMKFDHDKFMSNLKHDQDLTMLAKSHGYDLEKIGVQFQNSMKMMNAEQQYAMQRTMASINAERSMYAQKRKDQLSDQQWARKNQLDEMMMGIIVDTSMADRAYQIEKTGKGMSPSELGLNIQNHYNGYLNGQPYNAPSYSQIPPFSMPKMNNNDIMSFFGSNFTPGQIPLYQQGRQY